MMPVLIISAVYPVMYHFQQFRHASLKRVIAMIVAIALFYVWMGITVMRRRQDSFFEGILQAAFFVYVFCVLTLTGYFIFFNEVSAQHWWHKMVERVTTREGVNLQPLVFTRGYQLFNYEVVGNFIMLFPLGIFLPLLFKSLRNFFAVTIVAMMASVSIELMQLATNTRITDINDVILNTTGASLGFIAYALMAKMITPRQERTHTYS